MEGEEISLLILAMTINQIKKESAKKYAKIWTSLKSQCMVSKYMTITITCIFKINHK